VLRSGVGAAAPAAERGGARSISTPLLLCGMLLLAFIVRLVFIGADGFKNDVSTFESWSLTLADHPLRQFFADAGFADYPPGYFFVLWFVGHAYRLLVHSDPSYGALKVAVKLPAILMDLVDAALIFALVRRFATTAWAFAAATFFAFNPAAIFISAYWGQVDSVAGGMTLAAILLLVEADFRPTAAQTAAFITLAWLLLAYSILIKPPAVVLAPLFVAYVFATDSGSVRLRRALATLAGVFLSLALAYVSALAFHPGWSPLGQFAWLFGRYEYAANVYAYNSVNAFNLYVTLGQHFWQSDQSIIPNFGFGGRVLGLPQYVCGILLFVAALVLVVWRYVQRRDGIAFLEAAMILSLGYFVLSTRMHERYIFNGFMLAVPLIFLRRRYFYAAIVLSLTLFANLYYSLDYLHVLDDHITGPDPTDLMPWISRPAALANVVVFFYLGYVFLGNGADVLERFEVGPLVSSAAARVRGWFSPLEGVAWMRPVDWTLAAGFTLASFVLTVVNYTWPGEKIFDEIYYARAGEEYLQHKEIFEFTHPPLTKLLVAASMWLFGGMHGLGDTAAGWRFLNIVVGALMVLVMYCFARRLFGSTLWACVASGFLVFDGFHFAQARIATPEITVAFFTLLTLYAFYRYWLASQVRVAPVLAGRTAGVELCAIAALLVACVALDWLLLQGQSTAAHIVVFLYLGCGSYAAVRLFAPRFVRSATQVSYADGTLVTPQLVVTPDGGRIARAGGSITPGEATTAGKAKDALVNASDGFRITYGRDAGMRYATDDGEATFSADGTMHAGPSRIDGRRDGMTWLVVLAISAGCLGASKWNGLFDFFVVWLVVVVVAAQPYWSPVARSLGVNIAPRPAVWGNPLGFSVDVVVTLMLFVGASIYALCYIPYFSLGHNLTDVVSLQQQMYIYHHDTVAHATHPYSSRWWQWPILEIPISYYYHDFRVGAATQSGSACCVAEVMALPNPVTWWLGLLSVPYMAWLAWREKSKGFTLLVIAYFLQWLPWIASPRISFEYHFFPNLAIILLADTLVLQRIWQVTAGPALTWAGKTWPWSRVAVTAYLAIALAAFVFWYPVVAGTQISYDAWNARMLTGLEGSNWINPHPGK
jgi:Gpi18-like mannosyltransferase